MTDNQRIHGSRTDRVALDGIDLMLSCRLKDASGRFYRNFLLKNRHPGDTMPLPGIGQLIYYVANKS